MLRKSEKRGDLEGIPRPSDEIAGKQMLLVVLLKLFSLVDSKEASVRA